MSTLKKIANKIGFCSEKTLEVHDYFKDITEEMHQIYLEKNADYGNSFSESIKEFGELPYVIMTQNKLNRFKQLTINNGSAKVKSESVRDTLLDLANYTILMIKEIDEEEQRK